MAVVVIRLPLRMDSALNPKLDEVTEQPGATDVDVHLPNEIRTTLELVIEDLQLAHSFWRNAAASKATATSTAVRSERGGVFNLPTRG